MGRMYRALSSLRAEVLPKSRQHFALMAEGPLDELRRLERDVRAYVRRALPKEDKTKVQDANAA